MSWSSSNTVNTELNIVINTIYCASTSMFARVWGFLALMDVVAFHFIPFKILHFAVLRILSILCSWFWLAFDEGVVGLPPGVSVLWRQDANGLLVCLQGGVPDLLQLKVDLIHSQWGAVTVVHVQYKKLHTQRAGTALKGTIWEHVLHQWFVLRKHCTPINCRRETFKFPSGLESSKVVQENHP